jgi:hypothetical protein
VPSADGRVKVRVLAVTGSWSVTLPPPLELSFKLMSVLYDAPRTSGPVRFALLLRTDPRMVAVVEVGFTVTVAVPVVLMRGTCVVVPLVKDTVPAVVAVIAANLLLPVTVSVPVPPWFSVG